MIDPEPIHFLDEDGTLNPSETAAEFAAELDRLSLDDYRTWYADMLFARGFDQECTHLQRQGQLALWAPALGQEGAQVGAAHALQQADHVFPAYREHTVARVRGVDLARIAAQFRGVTNGGWDVTDPKNGNFHFYTLVLGAQTLHASGFALGQVLDAKARQGSATLDPGEPGVATEAAALVFYGDGTTSQGETNEALVFAASYQSPTVFFVQNNRWAISVPVERQSRTPLYRRGLGAGMPSVQIDGNDPLASYAVTRRFIDEARDGQGPRFIEALTYRMGAHTTSDDPTRYRPAGELDQWHAKDPLVRFEKFLRDKGVEQSFFDETAAAAKQYALEQREIIMSLPVPGPEFMFEHVYTDPHPRMNEQVDWLMRYENSFADDAEGGKA